MIPDSTRSDSRWFNRRAVHHGLFWLVVYTGLVWFLRQEGWPVISRGNTLILFLLLPVPVYVHFHLLERFFNRRKYPAYLLLTAALIPAFAALFRALFTAQMREYNGLVNFIVILGSFLAVTSGLKFSRANINNRIALERNRIRRLQNRLETIGRAVNPGMMLDTLHRLHHLSQENIDALPPAILDLAGKLRTALDGVKGHGADPHPRGSDSNPGEQAQVSPQPSRPVSATVTVNGGPVPHRRRRFLLSLILHSSWWLFITLVFFQFVDTGADPDWRYGAFFFFFTVVAAVDLNFYFLDLLLQKRRILLYGASAALVVAAYTLFFQRVVIGPLDLSQPVIQTVQDIVAVLVITTFARLTLQGMQRKLHLERIQSQQKQIELDLVTSRVNPHFLFNTLNNLYSLSLDRSPRLPGIIAKLTRLMAYMFEVSGRETVPLRGEVDFLKNYLDLERLRLPAASDIGFSVRGDPGDRQIPPMLFVPLVENCFKHGLRSDGGNLQADIEIGISPGRLRFSTGNPAADVNPASGGTGLRNLRRRLALLYENRHTLHIDRRNRRFECTMEIWE